MVIINCYIIITNLVICAWAITRLRLNNFFIHLLRTVSYLGTMPLVLRAKCLVIGEDYLRRHSSFHHAMI